MQNRLQDADAGEYRKCSSKAADCAELRKLAEIQFKIHVRQTEQE